MSLYTVIITQINRSRGSHFLFTIILKDFQFCCPVSASLLLPLLVYEFFPLALQPKSGLGHLTVEVSRSHTIRHTHPIGLLLTSDQLIAEVATYTTQNKHKERCGIRTRDTSNQKAADLRLRPHGHLDRLFLNLA
jgi:hypothetical protein